MAFLLAPWPYSAASASGSARAQRRLRPHIAAAGARFSAARTRRRCSGAAALSASAARGAGGRRTPVRVGGVVAVERGRGRVDIARVTGVSSDGATVDLVLLKEFVKEMYVDSGLPPTYERVENVRAVVGEYVPTEDGWIVLDQDLDEVKAQFQALANSGEPRETTVVITAEEKKKLSDEALRRQAPDFPRPTKSQALVGAIITVPLAAWSYSGFAGARLAFDASSVGDDAAAAGIRQAVLFGYASGAVLCLVVGAALLLYTLGGAAPSDNK